jgi:hypothetical protein
MFNLSQRHCHPKNEVFDLRSKLLGFYISGPATCSFTPNRDMLKDRERRFITWHRQSQKRSRFSSSLSTLQFTDMNYIFKHRKNWRQGERNTHNYSMVVGTGTF